MRVCFFKLYDLKWPCAPMRKNGNVHRLILNIASTKLQCKNINKKKDRGAFDPQNINRVMQSLRI